MPRRFLLVDEDGQLLAQDDAEPSRLADMTALAKGLTVYVYQRQAVHRAPAPVAAPSAVMAVVEKPARPIRKPVRKPKAVPVKKAAKKGKK